MCRLKNPTVAFILQKPMCKMYACSLSARDPPDRDVNWRHPVQGESPLSRVKNPTVVYMITCRLSFCKTGVQCTPAHNPRERL